VGSVFGFIRTRAADNTAWAALKQVETAADQAKIAADRHEEQTRADRERRITESFAKAVEQLGSDKQIATRLGGIYTLERIAGESEREYWPIMETLTAFVRERASRPSRGAQNIAGEAPDENTTAEPPKAGLPGRPPLRPATDIQAVLTVLGRRDKTAPKQFQEERAAERRLDLVATDLRGAHLSGAHLEGAIFWEAHLEHAILWDAHLEGADLSDAHLRGAQLWRAHLEHAILWDAHLDKDAILDDAHLQSAQLWRAHLEGARFSEAHLEGATFYDAHLEGATFHGAHVQGAGFSRAHLEGADLKFAVGLREYQLKEAFGDDRTTLPEGLLRPAHWPPSAPDEPDNPE
jgi:uncharacterized protein YjbI with pentapeptide repeats